MWYLNYNAHEFLDESVSDRENKQNISKGERDEGLIRNLVLTDR